MFAIGVEGRVGEFRRFGEIHVDDGFAPLMPDDEVAARSGRRKRDAQRGDHAVFLLHVAVADEETAGFIDQQLVQFGSELRTAESLRCKLEDSAERIGPCPAAGMHPFRIDLPTVANAGVHERLRALAVGRTFRSRDESLGLHGRNRKGNRPDAVDLQKRHRYAKTAVRAVVSRTVYLAQQPLKRLQIFVVFDELHYRTSSRQHWDDKIKGHRGATIRELAALSNPATYGIS